MFIRLWKEKNEQHEFYLFPFIQTFFINYESCVMFYTGHCLYVGK